MHLENCVDETDLLVSCECMPSKHLRYPLPDQAYVSVGYSFGRLSSFINHTTQIPTVVLSGHQEYRTHVVAGCCSGSSSSLRCTSSSIVMCVFDCDVSSSGDLFRLVMLDCFSISAC